MVPGVDNSQVTQYDSTPASTLEPIDANVSQVAYAVGSVVQQASETLASEYPGWSQFFHDLYQVLENEFKP